MDTTLERTSIPVSSFPQGNRLLDTLPESERARLGDGLHLRSLDVGQTLFEQGVDAPRAIFPLSGVSSLLAVTADGDSVEVATIGNEGMVGLHLFLGLDANWVSRAVQQIAGEGLTMPADRFRVESRTPGAFQDALLRYTQALFAQVTQGAACNRLHTLEQRCARWLLQCRDRVGADEFKLTQEFLAQMLGVRRPSVTLALGVLQRARVIVTRRGHIQIVNPDGLLGMSCGCYLAIHEEYERALPALADWSG